MPRPALDNKLTHFRHGHKIELYLTGSNLGNVRKVEVSSPHHDWVTEFDPATDVIKADAILRIRTKPMKKHKEGHRGSSDLTITLTHDPIITPAVETTITGVNICDE